MIPTLHLQEKDLYIIVSRLRALIESSNSGREVLTAARSYYVATTGSDANDGRSSSTAFLTLQHAYDVVRLLDFAGNNVTINVADGTYAAGVTISKPWVGSGTLSFVGNTSTPSNVHINTSANGFVVTGGSLSGPVLINGFKVTATGTAIFNSGIGSMFIRNIEFAACGAHIVAGITGSRIMSDTGLLSITGGASFFTFSDLQANISITTPLSLTGTPAFTVFSVASNMSTQIWDLTAIITGSATGQRFDVSGNSMINTKGQGVNYFPGNVAGTTSPDGVYL